MYNIWFCKIVDITKDNYLGLGYEKLIYEELKKEDILHHCIGLEKEFGKDFEFDRIDHERYVRFKNNNEYCLFIEEIIDEPFLVEEEK